MKYKIYYKKEHRREARDFNVEMNFPTETHALEYALEHLEPQYRVRIFEVNEFTGVEKWVLTKTIKKRKEEPELKGV
jgi:hypothetical protein